MIDPCDRETAWLQVTGDGLPELPATWDIIQAYWPGARLDAGKRGIYVVESRHVDRRSAGIRVMPRYTFTLKLVWPIKNVTGSVGLGGGLAETEQRNLKAAVTGILLRVRGPVGDKSHGARFLAVGETPSGQAPEAVYTDPELTLPDRTLRAAVVYIADDFEVNG